MLDWFVSAFISTFIMLIKELGIDPDALSSNNDTCNIHDINNLIINPHSQ